jgi:heat shock protein HtpX
MYEQIARNRRASWLLMGLVVAILAALGFVIGYAVVGGSSGAVGLLGVFGIAAILWSVIGYYAGDKMVLAASGARHVTHDEEPQLCNVVEEVSIAAGLGKPPEVYVIEDQALNAFATGRDPQHAAVAVTRGLLRRLDREELQGVLAHELSHVRNYDIRFATLVGVLVGMVALVADFFLRWTFWGGMGRRRDSSGGGDQGQMIFMIVALVLAILAPLAAYMVQFAISRRREYLADATAVQLTRNPLGLARALNEIASDPQPLRGANRATAHLFIANPLKGKKLKESAGLFDTHPPIQKRIAILLEMAHAAPDALTRSRQGFAEDAAAAGSGGAAGAAAPPPGLAAPAPPIVPGAAGTGAARMHQGPPPPPVVPH